MGVAHSIAGVYKEWFEFCFGSPAVEKDNLKIVLIGGLAETIDFR